MISTHPSDRMAEDLHPHDWYLDWRFQPWTLSISPLETKTLQAAVTVVVFLRQKNQLLLEHVSANEWFVTWMLIWRVKTCLRGSNPHLSHLLTEHTSAVVLESSVRVGRVVGTRQMMSGGLDHTVTNLLDDQYLKT